MRYFTLDALRGFALINMVAYHFCYDLRYLYGLPLRFMDERSGFCWQQMICWTFILVSGASAALSRRRRDGDGSARLRNAADRRDLSDYAGPSESFLGCCTCSAARCC